MRAFIRLLAFVVCLLPMLAKAQPYPPSPYLFLNQPNTWGAAQTFTGGMLFGTPSATATTQFSPLSKATNPILSPETQNSPSLFSMYLGAPFTQGWNDTWSATTGNGTYSQMTTDNVTLAGSPSVHYGLEERTLNVLGNSTTSGELNVSKFYLLISSGITATGIVDPFEAYLENAGTISGNPQTVNVQFFNDSNGSVPNGAGGVTVNWGNFNTTAGSLFQWSSFNCTTMNGNGAQPQAGRNYCLANLSDPTAEIATVGHVALRPNSTQGALTGCGTGATAGSRNNDMIGTVTEGTSATGCTVPFSVSYSFGTPICYVIPIGGGATLPTLVTPGNNSLVWTNASSGSSSYVYAYNCWATY